MATSHSAELIKYLTPGIKISATIQFGPDDSVTFTTTLIGYKAEQFLLLDFQPKVQEQLIMRKLTNAQMVVRGITDTELGHIVAFKTSIIQVISAPCSMFSLRLPKYFVTKTIREHERYKLSLPVSLTEYAEKSERKFEGELVDLSVCGCGIYIGGQNDLKVRHRVSFSCDLDNLLPNDMTSHIASIRRQNQGHLIGVQFEEAIELSDQLKMSLFEKFFRNNSF